MDEILKTVKRVQFTTLLVGRDSYAAQYAEENDLNYNYYDAND